MMPATSAFMPQTSIFDWVGLDQLESAPLRVAAAYWHSIRGPRLFPAREDLKARDMAGILPYMSLVKVIDGGADFEHRIVGDVMVRAFSVPIQNRRFSEIAQEAPELIEVSFMLFRKPLETRAPVAWRQRTGHDAIHTAFTESEIVLLPLGRSPDAIDHIVGFGVHESTAAPGV
jgi:hypothetical protein